MKKFFTILAALLTIIAGVIFAGNKVVTKKEESLRIMVLSNAAGINSDTKAFKPLEQKLSSGNDWKSFKSETEQKFSDIEILISGLRTRMEIPGAIADKKYMKKIVNLEEQVRYEKERLEAFEKNPVNWESFKPGFLYEIDAIAKKAKELWSYSETAFAEEGLKMAN